jgi:hypothetical protein
MNFENLIDIGLAYIFKLNYYEKLNTKSSVFKERNVLQCVHPFVTILFFFCNKGDIEKLF